MLNSGHMVTREVEAGSKVTVHNDNRTNRNQIDMPGTSLAYLRSSVTVPQYLFRILQNSVSSYNSFIHSVSFKGFSKTPIFILYLSLQNVR